MSEIFGDHNPPDLLFHYCGVDSLHAILKSKTLLLTAATGTNDAEEHIRVLNILREMAKVAAGRSQERLKLIMGLIDEIKVGAKFAVPFIACLSEDGDVLSQWRGYAADGEGVAIGFNMPIFGLKSGPPSLGEDDKLCTGIAKIEYDPIRQREIVSRLFAKYEEVEDKGRTKSIDGSLIANDLWRLSLLFKNSGFSEEKEWRVIHTPIHDTGGGFVGAIAPPQTRVRNGRVVSSIPISIDPANRGAPIVSVIRGPKCRTHPFDLRVMLDEFEHFDAQISNSKISYR